jgi:hypothetical protein
MPAVGSVPRVRVLILCLATLSAGQGQAVCQSRAPLQLQQLSLELQVSVDYQQDRLEGLARLTVRNAGSAPVRRIPLLLNRLMSVHRVTDAAGHELRYIERVVRFADEPKLQVEFAEVDLLRPLASGGRTELVVHYEGSLVGYVETGSLYIRDHLDTAFTILRTDAYAFPVIGRPSWKANRAVPRSPFAFRARVTVPEGLVVVTGGRRLGERRSNGRVTWEYGSTGPIPFLNIAIAPYIEIGQRRIRAYVFREDSAGARRAVAKAEEALDSLTRWFGTLGEEPRVTLIEIPPGYGSQASLSAGIIQDASAFRNASRLHELYHELSHFWNPRDTAVPSPRVTEGLASLLERRLAGALDGWTGLDSLVERAAAELRARASTDSALRVIPLRSYGVAGRTDFSYSVGMLLFYSLERCVGVSAFDALWGDYLRKTRLSGGSDQDFATFASLQSGNPAVRALFDTWFFTTHWMERLSAGESLAGLGAECRRSP